MKIGNRVFENYTYVMAIVNLTPDSFWQGSRNTSDSVLYAVERAVRDGASVIDLGRNPRDRAIRRFPPKMR